MCPPVPCRGISLYLVIYLQGHAEISSNTSSPLLVSFEFSLGGVHEERNRNPCLTEQKKKKKYLYFAAVRFLFMQSMEYVIPT